VPFTRLVRGDDAAALAEILVRNREFMAPSEPHRDESFYTVEGQLQVIAAALAEHQHGIRLPHVILDDDGSVVGRATLNEIVRGPLQSASLGYHVDRRRNGRGLASRRQLRSSRSPSTN
jgi:ribosomal-protein-alanine N-acetyltransferase